MDYASPAAPASSASQALADQRALRAKLSELHEAVKGYFEATNVGQGGGYWRAFDALRKNQPLAESFVGDLKALLDCIGAEVLPALLLNAGAETATGRPTPTPTRQAPVAQAAAPPAPVSNINEDETMLFGRMPAKVQQEIARFQASKQEAKSEGKPGAKNDPKNDAKSDPKNDARPAASSQPLASAASPPRKPPATPPQAARSSVAPSRPLPGVTHGAATASKDAEKAKAPEIRNDKPSDDQGDRAAAPKGAIAARIAAGSLAPGAGRGTSSLPVAKAADRPAAKADAADQPVMKGDAADRSARANAPASAQRPVTATRLPPTARQTGFAPTASQLQGKPAAPGRPATSRHPSSSPSPSPGVGKTAPERTDKSEKADKGPDSATRKAHSGPAGRLAVSTGHGATSVAGTAGSKAAATGRATSGLAAKAAPRTPHFDESDVTNPGFHFDPEDSDKP